MSSTTQESSEPKAPQQEAPQKVTTESQPAQQGPSLGLQMDSATLSHLSALFYSPFVYGVGKKAVMGAAWGGFFGLILFRSNRWRKASIFYGAGVGLGMNAPLFKQGMNDFFGVESKDTEVHYDSDEFYQELDSIKEEIILRNKFKH